jgi:hypothetical protein
MKKNKVALFLIICSLPFAIIVAVNELPNNPEPTHKYVEDRCTWYCHDVTCPHWKKSYAQEPTQIKKMHKDIFTGFVNALHNNPLGLNYGAINILVFFLFYPMLGAALLWRLITKLM